MWFAVDEAFNDLVYLGHLYSIYIPSLDIFPCNNMIPYLHVSLSEHTKMWLHVSGR